MKNRIRKPQLDMMLLNGIINEQQMEDMINSGLASSGTRVAGGKGLVVLQKLNSINEQDRTVNQRRAIKLIERLNKTMTEINTPEMIDVLQGYEQISKVSANWNK